MMNIFQCRDVMSGVWAPHTQVWDNLYATDFAAVVAPQNYDVKNFVFF